MDDVEREVLQAWFRLLPRLRSDPRELARRLARRAGATLRSPPRPWCLALRANDTRLNKDEGGGMKDESGRRTVPPTQPSSLILHPSALASLIAPVELEAPGLSLAEAARKLGTTPCGLLPARVAGTFRQRYVEGLGGRWGHPHPILYTDAELDPQSRRFATPDRAWSWTAGGRALARRIPPDLPPQTLTRVPHYAPRVGRDRYRDTTGLQSEHPALDPPPPRRKSRALPDPPPDPAAWYKWKDGVYLGYDWRNPLAKRNYERHERALTKARIAAKKRRMKKGPAPRFAKGSLEFRGYRWLCPRCQRRVSILYLPLPPINLIAEFHKSRGDDAEYVELISRQMAVGGRQKEEHKNGDACTAHSRLPTAYSSSPAFACRSCHRVRCVSRGAKHAWGDLVAALSGGLLYGNEVKRPAWWTRQRTNRYAPRPTRPPSRRRAQIEAGLLAGHDMKSLAAALGLKTGTVIWYAQQIYRRHGVGSLKELLLKHGKPTRPYMRGKALGKRGEGRVRRRRARSGKQLAT